jgi:hypothetical protein
MPSVGDQPASATEQAQWPEIEMQLCLQVWLQQECPEQLAALHARRHIPDPVLGLRLV